MNYFLKTFYSLLFLAVLILPLVFITQQKKQEETKELVETSKQIQILGEEKKRPDHLIVLLGDSMTEYMGNSDELRQYMAQYYPGKTFDFLNYGFGSTNILSVEKRLLEWNFYGRDFMPIMDIDFDLIFIESFGHNPLSDYPLQEGLKKQNEALDKIVEIITTKHPKNKIVFVATISPNSKTYAYRTVEMDDKTRKIWTEERRAYIKNHIKYGKDHGLPVVNVFEKSLDLFGDGNMDYISDTDYIHPSPKGVYLISKEIADFIYKETLLPRK